MNDFSKKLNRVKATVKLGDDRKAAVHSHLVNYMEQNPVDFAGSNAKVRLSVASRFSAIFHMFSLVSLKPFPLVALLIVIFLVGTAGTAAAAENALPGELLYTWKTGVNEKIQLQLIRDADQKAEFEMTLATRRLVEAETLADQGKLGSAEQELVRSGFEQYSKQAQSRVEKLVADDNQEGADKLKQRLTAVIESHQEQLAAVKARSNISIDSKLDVTDNTILSSQAVINLNGNFKKNDEKDSLKLRRQADIKKAQNLLIEARLKLKAGQKEDALKLNQEAIEASKKARQDYDRDDREGMNGDTDDIVVPKIEEK